eukprot:TRINITY_DN36806_c0_g1_i1.p1 TRINITY_DN36806_c0_g1~~TRINITY_DN36806_c0_g1_i1.p1  ORF type:complete len:384 (+),score=121.33 TRINITY_DN36806_c0_g1_i1:103-1254(+)
MYQQKDSASSAAGSFAGFGQTGADTGQWWNGGKGGDAWAAGSGDSSGCDNWDNWDAWDAWGPSCGKGFAAAAVDSWAGKGGDAADHWMTGTSQSDSSAGKAMADAWQGKGGSTDWSFDGKDNLGKGAALGKSWPVALGKGSMEMWAALSDDAGVGGSSGAGNIAQVGGATGSPDRGRSRSPRQDGNGQHAAAWSGGGGKAGAPWDPTMDPLLAKFPPGSIPPHIAMGKAAAAAMAMMGKGAADEKGGAIGGRDWQCSCGFFNRGKNSVCGGLGGTLGCKKAQPGPAGKQAAAATLAGKAPPKTLPCKFFGTFVGCYRGDKCHFLHKQPEKKDEEATEKKDDENPFAGFTFNSWDDAAAKDGQNADSKDEQDRLMEELAMLAAD